MMNHMLTGDETLRIETRTAKTITAAIIIRVINTAFSIIFSLSFCSLAKLSHCELLGSIFAVQSEQAVFPVPDAN